jgi:hypothetical protein
LFVEDSKQKNPTFNFKFTYALAGENIFDIANRTNVSLKQIVESNDYEDLFAVKEGDKVMLC